VDLWEEIFRSIRRGAKFPIKIEEAVANMKVITDARRGTSFEIKPKKAKRSPSKNSSKSKKTSKRKKK
jgi:hypothetical protein